MPTPTELFTEGFAIGWGNAAFLLTTKGHVEAAKSIEVPSQDMGNAADLLVLYGSRVPVPLRPREVGREHGWKLATETLADDGDVRAVAELTKYRDMRCAARNATTIAVANRKVA